MQFSLFQLYRIDFFLVAVTAAARDSTWFSTIFFGSFTFIELLAYIFNLHENCVEKNCSVLNLVVVYYFMSWRTKQIGNVFMFMFYSCLMFKQICFILKLLSCLSV